MGHRALLPDFSSILVIYGFSLHLSHFSNNRSGGWGASNKHCALKKLPHRGTPAAALLPNRANSAILTQLQNFDSGEFSVQTILLKLRNEEKKENCNVSPSMAIII